jgi:hypothetical protein
MQKRSNLKPHQTGETLFFELAALIPFLSAFIRVKYFFRIKGIFWSHFTTTQRRLSSTFAAGRHFVQWFSQSIIPYHKTLRGPCFYKKSFFEMLNIVEKLQNVNKKWSVSPYWQEQGDATSPERNIFPSFIF